MGDFASKLREEINKSQDRRSALVHKKLSYVAATFGVGALSNIYGCTTSAVLFLAPIMAFAFDLYIAGEDFGIKRAGGFLGRVDSSASEEEKIWEARVKEHGDPFSKMANPFVSYLSLCAAAVVLWPAYINHWLYLPWLAVNVFLIFALWASSHFINKALKEFGQSAIVTKNDTLPNKSKTAEQG